jgi:hypothetical protein
MRNWTRGILRAAVVSCSVMGLLLLSGLPAFADGNGAQTFTQTFHNATDTFAQPNPCTGDPGTVSITYNGVMHFTINKAGDLWATGTETGGFVFTPDPQLAPNAPSYTGHFTTWFGVSDNNRNGVDHSTFSLHGVGSDGSTLAFHETQHFSINANGDITVAFDKVMCG